jgi:hypothetical protein
VSVEAAILSLIEAGPVGHASADVVANDLGKWSTI